MEINATLLGQMITFIMFAVFTMKYVWPPLLQAIESRQKEIQSGLDAAKAGHEEFAKAQEEAKALLQEARDKCDRMLDNTKIEISNMMEESSKKVAANQELQIKRAEEEISQMKMDLEHELKSKVSSIVLLASEKVLGSSLDKKANDKLINSFISDLN